MNPSYNEIKCQGKCVDYAAKYAGNSMFWVETWRINNTEYYAVFSDHHVATLPITITKHEFLS